MKETSTLTEARMMLDSIAEYTLFLHRVFSDASNMGYVEEFQDGEWLTVDEDETEEE